MARFKLAFGIHNHQPVGNFDSVFENAHQQAYLPFLQLFKSYEGLALSLHQSGILWEWQKRHHPEYFELVRHLVESRRVELMSGGFFEPILSMLPEADAVGQIARMSNYLSENFGVVATGHWLTERIWEPHLPKLLAEADTGYLALDDTHFLYAGLEQSDLTGPFTTESEGRAVRVLPIQKRLRYLIPFGSPEEIIDELKSQAEKDPEGMAVYADDGEKFGVWPDTHAHCYKDGWLPRFFEAVLENSDWLEMVPLGVAASCEPAGRVYLPTAAYEEMLHWSLPTKAYHDYEEFEAWLKTEGQHEKYHRFVRGGHWRGFLAKYDEANLMHKRMLRVSERLARFEQENPDGNGETDSVRDKLYAAQCNCPYWHGVFGGLYLPHIRQAVYGNLAAAESGLWSLEKRKELTFSVEDFDADGSPEIIVENGEMTSILKPGRGGMLLDFSLTRLGFDLTDTLSRREEGYHRKLVAAARETVGSGTASIHSRLVSKEAGLEKYLVKDWYLKRCLIDHFFAGSQTFGLFCRGEARDEGDFVLEPYQFELDHFNKRLQMTRRGHLFRNGNELPVQVSKTVSFDEQRATIDIRYELTSSEAEFSATFGVENNFSFQAGHASDRYMLIDGIRLGSSFLDSTGQSDQARAIAMVDDYRSLAVAVTSESPAEIWHLPIFTVSLSESGFERVYQGTTLVHLFKVTLSPEPVSIHLTIVGGDRSRVLKPLFGAKSDALNA